MSTHVYYPLEGPDHIRLIALYPASSKDAPLEITFLASTLEDLEGRYEAISYTWGQPLLTCALHVDDGTQVCVTENLDRALRYLRYNDRDRLLWADAACINQSDDAEKAVQIPLMVDIFRGAQRVMAWLDPGGDTAVEQRGMQIVKRLSRPSEMRHSIWAEGCKEVNCFIKLPWFNRLWIVQEVVFSVEVCMICGDTEIAFPRFIAALSFIQEEAFPLESDDRARVDAIAKIWRLWSRHSLFGTQPMSSPQSSLYERHSSSNDILSLVEAFALYACTDPRDRLFALLSMAAKVQPAGSVSDGVTSSTSQGQRVVSTHIDYSLNVLETYKAFAISCWRERHTHKDMWEALILRQHTSRPLDWPSWVPDWRVLPKKTLPIQKTKLYHNFRVISATRSGICLETGRHRPLPDKDNGQPYIVRSNISRHSVGSEHSIESQLFQLCSLATGPETAQNPNPFTGERQRPSWTSCTMRFPNLLYRTVSEGVLHLNVDSGLPQDEPHEDLLQWLIEYLSSITTGTKERDRRYRHMSTSSRRRHHIHDFERASKDVSNLFVFHDPCTQVNSIGYGIVAPEVGDTIVPMGDMLDGDLVDGTMTVMILRRINLMETSIVDTPTYRFIGSGRIFDPTLILLALRKNYSSQFHCRYVRNRFILV